MKKYIYRIASFMFVAASVVACSSNEEMTENTKPDHQTQSNGNTVMLTGKLAAKGNGETTRALSSNGATSWQTGEQIAVYYQKTDGSYATATATVQADDNDEQTATFTAELLTPKSGTVKLVYPASRHDGTGGYSTEGIVTQDGSLATVSTNWDIATASPTLTRFNDGTYSLNSGSVVMLQNQLCLCTFNLKDEDNNSLSATKLVISAGTKTYTITPTSATSSFTVALLPTSSANFTFSATTTRVGRVYTRAIKTVSSPTGTRMLPVSLNSRVSSENIGDVFDKTGAVYKVTNGAGVVFRKSSSGITLISGKFYSPDLTLEESGSITPVGMIVYYYGTAGSADSSGNYRGLAIALEDAPSYYSWYTENTGPCVTQSSTFSDYWNASTSTYGMLSGIENTNTLAGGCGAGHVHAAAVAAKNYSVAGFDPTTISGCSGWFLPTASQWMKFFEKAGVMMNTWTSFGYFAPGTTENLGASGAAYTAVNNMLINAGAAPLDDCYWTSSEYNDIYAIWLYFVYSEYRQGILVDGGSENDFYRKTMQMSVRPFLAF